MCSYLKRWGWSQGRKHGGNPIEHRCYMDMDYDKPFPDIGQDTGPTTLEDLAHFFTTAHPKQGKRCLDLYLPAPSPPTTQGSAGQQAPLLIFVHGGGWRRGDKQGWKHYVSDHDTNILVAFLFWIFGLYGSIGETLARAGFACAVVSYPLSRLTFPRCLTEQLMSFSLSLLPLWLLLSLLRFALSTVAMLTAFFHKEAQKNLNYENIALNSPVLSTFIITIAIRWCVMFRRLLSKQTLSINTEICTLLAILITIIIYLFMSMHQTYHELNSGSNGSNFTNSLFSIITLALPILPVEMYFVHRFLHTDTVTHPDHVRAIACCVRWLLRVGQAARGTFDTSGVFLMGHSAGGHLVSLLAVREHYLREVGLDRRVIKVGSLLNND